MGEVILCIAGGSGFLDQAFGSLGPVAHAIRPRVSSCCSSVSPCTFGLSSSPVMRPTPMCGMINGGLESTAGHLVPVQN